MRKIIQAMPSGGINEDGSSYSSVIVLCDDGTLWEHRAQSIIGEYDARLAKHCYRKTQDSGWRKIPSVPQDDKK